MYVLDTNAIIYYLKGKPRAVAFLERILSQDSPLYVSTITEAELLGFPRLTDDELAKMETILSTLSIIPLDSRLARLAGFIRRTYQLKIPDAIIAATPLFRRSTLVTRNVHDFKKVKELKVLGI